MTLTIIASVIVKEEFLQDTKLRMLDLVEQSKQEKGCLKYTLHQDNKNSDTFLFIENWQSKTLWEKHLESLHVQSFVKETENSIVEFSVQEMSQI
ncbi:hypothetical protein A9Q87_09135 [Flavobacteriales bacterium 34_180_T64]|nr:hypothetical protein A9Q87_09135 [Flavobacteriales bacterium 34_180_T64]